MVWISVLTLFRGAGNYSYWQGITRRQCWWWHGGELWQITADGMTHGGSDEIHRHRVQRGELHFRYTNWESAENSLWWILWAEGIGFWIFKIECDHQYKSWYKVFILGVFSECQERPQQWHSYQTLEYMNNKVWNMQTFFCFKIDSYLSQMLLLP